MNISFENFWQNLDKIKSEDIINYGEYLRPECRSSTIFPVFKDDQTKTLIEYLAYWSQKHGNSVVLKLTARDLLGNIKKYLYKPIWKYCAHSFDASELFDEKNQGFCGSVEVEVFSEEKPKFTFPALTLSIVNKVSSSVVHSCIRTFNKFEKINDEALDYLQTGFDVEIGLGKRNYICFFGGHEKEYHLNISLCEASVTKKCLIILRNINYGQSHFIILEDLFGSTDLELLSKPKCSIEHNFIDVFPRFYAGIIEKGFCPTLTHTFFDTSQQVEFLSSKFGCNNDQECLEVDKAFRADNASPQTHYDSSFIIPIYRVDEFNTSLMTYGQNIPYNGRVDVELLSCEGDVLFSRKLNETEVLSLSGHGEFNLMELIYSNGFHEGVSLSLKISFVDENNPFPMRFKMGLNVRRKSADRGANICFAPLVMQKNTLQKPFARKWFPIGGTQKFVASIHNTTLSVKKNKKFSKFMLEFVNAHGSIMKRVYRANENSSLFIYPEIDHELEKFLAGKVGWCMVTAETYMFDAYYLTLLGEQIGGDHAF